MNLEPRNRRPLLMLGARWVGLVINLEPRRFHSLLGFAMLMTSGRCQAGTGMEKKRLAAGTGIGHENQKRNAKMSVKMDA